MIISASRRTDIPAFFSDWFFGRLKEGFVRVRNPMNPSNVRTISLAPDDTDCIVFWTKNPQSMMERLDELKNYSYYFQFTLNSYGRDIEPYVPSKSKYVIDTFKRLSDKIGRERVVWRYDPILITDKYSVDYHVKWFEMLAKELSSYCDACVISFADKYGKNAKSFSENNMRELFPEEIEAIAKNFSQVGKEYVMSICTCAEKADLSKYGIGHSSCIDISRIQRISNRSVNIKKDRNQRKECGCAESTDIGTYNTCMHGCRYCYANYSLKSTEKNYRNYDAASPLLCGRESSAK